MAITFDRTNKFILITAPQVLVTIQNLIDAIRTYEALDSSMDMPILATCTGKQVLGAGNYVSLTLELLDGWTIKFEDRVGPTYTTCQIVGGNLVQDLVTGFPITQASYVMVTICSSSDAMTFYLDDPSHTLANSVDAVLTANHGTGSWQGNLTLLASIGSDVEFIRRIESGRWKIESNQMTFYDSDGATVLLQFDLKDIDGNPTNVNVFERVPV